MNEILVGVPSGVTVPIPFQESLPEAIRLRPKQGRTLYHNIRGTNTVSARNKIIYYAMTHKERKFTHVFFMDSDMWFPPKTLSKLLKHDKDIVGGYYVRKRKGFLPNAFVLGYRTPDGRYMTDHCNELKEVEAIGTGCLLIKMEVFEKVGCPWFEYKLSKGDPDGHMVTEDMVFCEKAKALGYQVWCDGTIKCGHVNSFIVFPTQKSGKIEVKPV